MERGRGVRHEIRVIKVRKAIASEYVKAEFGNDSDFIFHTILTKLVPSGISGVILSDIEPSCSYGNTFLEECFKKFKVLLNQ